MDVRDRARSDLYLAQLRSQSAPNTPGFGPMSPSYSTYMKSPRFPDKSFTQMSEIEEGDSPIEPGTRFVDAKPNRELTSKPFALQPPPIKVHAASPKVAQGEFVSPFARDPAPPKEYQRVATASPAPAPVAADEQIYAAVPIPGAYVSPASPGPRKTAFGGLPGQAC